jgi:REP element-mobilizing transposase RayT
MSSAPLHVAQPRLPVIAYHLILTFYGFWLPNDPRGSWSDFVRAWELRRFGSATKTHERRSLARDKHDIRKRLEAKQALARPPVQLDGVQARAVIRGFSRFVDRSGIKVFACAILPEHVHLVIGRHHYSIEEIARHLKADATTELNRERVHPARDYPYRNGSLPSPWARGEWKCFIDNEDYTRNAVRYVNRNPTREGRKPQSWSFIAPLERA